jgi:hypothetical protein
VAASDRWWRILSRGLDPMILVQLIMTWLWLQVFIGSTLADRRFKEEQSRSGHRNPIQ